MDYNPATAAAHPASAVDTDPAVAGSTPNAFVFSAQATLWIEFVKIPFEVPPGSPAHPRLVTVTTCRCGSAAIWDWQNLSVSQRLLLNSLVWSAKCADDGLDDSE